MADNYKILAQTTAASIEPDSGLNQANVVYTVPANTQVAISSVSLINSSIVPESYSIGIVRSQEALSSYNKVDYNVGSEIYIAFPAGLGIFITSTNGIDWDITGSGEFFPGETYWNMSDIAYGADRFIAVGTFNAPTGLSYDGVSWTKLPALQSSNIVYGNGLFVAVRYSSAYSYSTDGITWTEGSLPTAGQSLRIWYANNKFVILSSDSFGLYSTDGITWNQSTVPAVSGLSRPTYGNDRFVAISVPYDISTNSYIAGPAIISTDGIVWTQVPTPAGITTWNNAVAYGNGLFVIVDTNNLLTARSTDGVSWVVGSLPAGYQFSSINYAGDRFIVGGKNHGAYSYDANTWTIFQLPTNPLFANASYSKIVFGSSLQSLQANIPVINTSQTIIPTRSIESNTVDEITGGITLSAGDQIRVYSESEDLIVQVYGVEIS